MNEPAYIVFQFVCVCVCGDMNNVCVEGRHMGVYVYIHGVMSVGELMCESEVGKKGESEGGRKEAREGGRRRRKGEGTSKNDRASGRREERGK